MWPGPHLIPLPQSTSSMILFQSNALRTAISHGEVDRAQLVDIVSRKVAAVIKAIVPDELSSKELQPNDKMTPSPDIDARMAPRSTRDMVDNEVLNSSSRKSMSQDEPVHR